MAKVIAFANHKGGVGKTTSVANVGAALSTMGYKVLLVDLDSQRNLSTNFLLDEVLDEVKVTTYSSIVDGRPLPIISINERLALSPASPELVLTDIKLAAVQSRETRLKRAIDGIKESYDYILLDCPPSLGVITTNALTAATDVLIPLIAEAVPVRGLKMIEEAIEAIRQTSNPSLSLSGIFITRYNNRRLNSEIVKALRSGYNELVYDTMIRECIAIAEAPLQRSTIMDYSSSSNGSTDYHGLAEEIALRIEVSK